MREGEQVLSYVWDWCWLLRAGHHSIQQPRRSPASSRYPTAPMHLFHGPGHHPNTAAAHKRCLLPGRLQPLPTPLLPTHTHTLPPWLKIKEHFFPMSASMSVFHPALQNVSDTPQSHLQILPESYSQLISFNFSDHKITLHSLDIISPLLSVSNSIYTVYF